MNRRFFIPVLLLLAVSSCQAPLALQSVETSKNQEITPELPEDPKILQTIAPYKSTMDREMNTKISYAPRELSKVGDNSPLGGLLADYTLESAQKWGKQNGFPEVEAAVINIGGIRTSIGKGDVLLRHIYEVMPFENELVLVQMKGTDLGALFAYYLKTRKNNPVAGLYIKTKGEGIEKALIQGKEIDPDKTYTIATSDYLALGGDEMSFFSLGKMVSTGLKLRDLYIEKIRSEKELIGPTDLRLEFQP